MSRTFDRSLALFAALTLALLGVAGEAAAQPVPLDDPDAALQATTPARFVIGFKTGAGGTLWDSPDETVLVNGVADTDSTFELPIFDETRGGFTFTTGFFVEGIFYDYFGIEVGAYFTQHRLLENVNWNYFETVNSQVTRQVEAKSRQELHWTALHVPILIKAVVPSGKTRISLGVGPEFAFGSWAKAKFQINEVVENGVEQQGDDLQLAGNRAALQTLRAKLEDSIYFTVNFGIEIVVGDFLVPIDIHWSYNFSQGKRYRDRVELDRLPVAGGPVTVDNHPTEVTLKTRDTMYGGIRVGLAYQFD